MSIYPIYIDSTTSGSQLSIGTVNASTILFGNVNSSTTVNGLFSVSNISINGNLAMGTGKNITLAPSTSYTTPTEGTQLGGTTNGTLSTMTDNSGVAASIIIPSPGIYLFVFNLYRLSTSKGQTNGITLSGTGTNNTKYSATIGSSLAVGISGSQVVTATATTYELTFNTNSTFGTNQFEGFFTATRIA